MKQNLLWKSVFIIAVLLVFVYGIFGIPSSVSGQGRASALLQRIHLGLDLKGGTHLILQVQVKDAINVTTDNDLEVLKDGMKKAKINYADIAKPDSTNHPEQIVIKGVPPDSTSTLRDLIQTKLPD